MREITIKKSKRANHTDVRIDRPLLQENFALKKDFLHLEFIFLKDVQ